MATTFKSLYEKRCNKDGKPQYWKPRALPNVEMVVSDSGVPESIKKILASALFLEIDVRQYVSELFRDLEINQVSPICKALILSNIADESVHAAQFRYAIDAYPVNDIDLKEAEVISEAWKNAPGSPIEKAALLEVGVFVACSLPILLRCGGSSLARLSRMVAEDEQRHVATNLGVLQKFGYNPFSFSPELDKLRLQTIDWQIKSLNIKRWGINKDWFIDRSNEMVTSGASNALSDFTSFYQDDMPFEVSNAFLTY
jgi:hypothetical protein